MSDVMKVNGFSAPHMGVQPQVHKRVVFFVQGPDGFTETFDAHTVDLLCRMGLIALENEDDPDTTGGYHYKAFKATGREVVK